MTVLENVEVTAAGLGQKKQVSRRLALEILDHLSIADKAKTIAGALPYTDERRVGIARALVVPPAFVLLDEPAAGMTDTECDELMKVISNVPNDFGCGVLIVEHNMRAVMGTCHGNPRARQRPNDRRRHTGRDQSQSRRNRGVPGKQRCETAPARKMMMLEVDGLSVRYGRLTALRGISLKVDEGQIVCIIGPNGAGKSTTLAAIAGGVGIQSGTVRWRNQVISGLVPEAISRLGLALMPEGRHIFSTLSVEESVWSAPTSAATARHRPRICSGRSSCFRDCVSGSAPAGRVSGGEQQMLVICRALLTNARLLLIDEPSLGLAPKIIDQVYEMLRDLQPAQRAHLVDQRTSRQKRILKIADHVYVLRNGRSNSVERRRG